MPLGRAVLFSSLALIAGPIRAQTYFHDLIRNARIHLAARQWDSAARDLDVALDHAPYIMDSCWAYIWRGVLEYERGSLALARLNFRRALLLHPDPRVSGYGWLDSMPAPAVRLFDSEYRAVRVFPPGDPDQPARWIVRPAFEYPAELLERRAVGLAVARWIVDTSGRADRRSIEVLETPDSAFLEPLKSMLAAAQFQPATIAGRPVRSFMAYQFKLRPASPQNPIQLVDDARRQLHDQRPDSALLLVNRALDPSNGPTPAIQVYAELVKGIAWHAKKQEPLAAHSFHVALARYHELQRRGVDFAPLLRALADSVRLTHQREYKGEN